MNLVINGRLITRDTEGKGYYEHGAVAYEGSKIVEVGEESALRRKYPDAHCIDARGGVIMPALINAHTHIYSALARGLSIVGNDPTNFYEVLDGTWWAIDRKLMMDGTRASATAPQQGAGGDLGGLAHRGGLVLFQLRRSGLDGKAHIGAGIAVRHGEYVQVVDGLLFTGDTGGAEGDHLLEGAAADFFCHALASPPTDVHHTVMESTKTFTSRTSTPVFLVTTYLTSPIMERHTVAIFTPFSTMMCSSMDTVPSSL